MPEVRFDLEVWCSRCGKGICHLVTTRRKPGEIQVDPCDNCLDIEHNRGYEEGQANG